jgi:glycosyl transferase family 25
MAEQLARTELEYEFVAAVDGSALTASDRAKLVDKDVVGIHPHWMNPGQIGCALSHLRVYQRRARAGGAEIALVLEDDVILPSDIGEVCRKIGAHMRGREIVLLYFRAFGTCRFSAQDAVELKSGVRLLYPVDVGQPITASAYLVTAEACRGLAEVILPVRAGADNWGHFYGIGAIESLRCVLPRAIGVRNDFKSTIDHTRVRAPRAQVTTFVDRHRVVGAFQLLTMNRKLIERRMSKTAIVPERSAIAIARAQVRGGRVHQS